MEKEYVNYDNPVLSTGILFPRDKPAEFELGNVQAVNKVEAYDWLKKAIDAGWPYFRFGERDPKFENIRNEERFKQMMAGVKKKIGNMRKKIEQKEKQE